MYNGVEYTTRGRCFAGVRPRVEHPDNLSFNWTHPVDYDERPVELMMNSCGSLPFPRQPRPYPVRPMELGIQTNDYPLFSYRAPLSEASAQPVV